MSWNKNTLYLSEVAAIVRTLQLLKEPYELSVRGVGLNDADGMVYQLYRLAFRDVVVLEQMIRDPDCDGDDYVESEIFTKENEPSDWECVIDLEDPENNL